MNTQAETTRNGDKPISQTLIIREAVNMVLDQPALRRRLLKLLQNNGE
jgi:hypothetical protein